MNLTIIVSLIILTLASLVAGLLLMARGGKMNEKYSNKLMSIRVMLQAVTFILLFVLIYKR